MKFEKREIKPVLVVNKAGKLRTDSLTVAKVFEREHKNLLRDIRNIVESDAYRMRIESGISFNFELMTRQVDIGNNAKRSEPYYEMDRQGFEILAMGFTGGKALEWKFKYSDAFAAMESELLAQKSKFSQVHNPFNLEDLGLEMLQVDVSQRQAQKVTRTRLMYVLARQLRCGNQWIRRLTNEIYKTLLDEPLATARNFRHHMNLPVISASHLTRDQLEGHIQIFVSGIEQSMLILWSANQEITFGELRDFALDQAKLCHKQLLRIVQQKPAELIFQHEYNVVPIFPYQQRRQSVQAA